MAFQSKTINSQRALKILRRHIFAQNLASSEARDDSMHCVPTQMLLMKLKPFKECNRLRCFVIAQSTEAKNVSQLRFLFPLAGAGTVEADGVRNAD